MTRAGMTATLIWALTAILAAVIALRASYTTDLSAFLPRRATPAGRPRDRWCSWHGGR